MRSPKSLCDEAEYLKKNYKLNIINFSADTFTVNKKWVMDFCREYRSRRIGLPWICNSRVDTLDYKTLKEMKRAGCIWVSIGVESGNQGILDFLQKLPVPEPAGK